jgi:protein-tyrosine phosphatase
MKVLFVCLGNICRSPLAEEIFKQKTQKLGLADTFLADSCGTANYHIGDIPDPRTIKNARRNGI